jgi:hypothetical protein
MTRDVIPVLLTYGAWVLSETLAFEEALASSFLRRQESRIFNSSGPRPSPGGRFGRPKCQQHRDVEVFSVITRIPETATGAVPTPQACSPAPYA